MLVTSIRGFATRAGARRRGPLTRQVATLGLRSRRGNQIPAAACSSYGCYGRPPLRPRWPGAGGSPPGTPTGEFESLEGGLTLRGFSARALLLPTRRRRTPPRWMGFRMTS
jgi:hypothetical protein